MQNDEFINEIHKRISVISIGSSALRNQGAPKIIETTRNYLLKNISLEDFFTNLSDEEKFRKYLNENTIKLRNKYPENAQSWGAARKGLNLFFREVVYNKFISDHYNLPKNIKQFNSVIQYLEIPLDHDVSVGIKNNSENKLPKWPGIRNLKKDISDAYQEEAFLISQREKIARVHLDLKYWRPVKK